MRNRSFVHDIAWSCAAATFGPVLGLALGAGPAGAAGIALETELLTVQSTQSYGLPGARTRHVFTFPEAPHDDVAVELVAQGDYGLVNETATLSLDGVRAGAVGGTGADCIAATGNYTIAHADMIQFVADGTLYADVQNTLWVNLICDANTHRVTMQYRLPLRALTLTAAYPGATAPHRPECRRLSSPASWGLTSRRRESAARRELEGPRSGAAGGRRRPTSSARAPWTR